MLVVINGKNKEITADNFNQPQDRILAENLGFAEKNAFGIYEPQGTKKEYLAMVVCKVGPNVKDVEPNIVEGCIILVRPGSGIAFSEHNKKYLVVRVTEVVTYVHEEDVKDVESTEE